MFIDGIDRLVVRPEQSMREVIEVIDRAELQVALVVDEGRHLLGTITDGDVRRALSHPQALAQCEHSLRRLGIEPVDHYDTAGAARDIAANPRPDTAAIASALAAEIYGLEVLVPNLEDQLLNFTRFFVLGAEEPERRDPSKTSIVFATRHVPGALHAVMHELALRDINMTKIQSRPRRNRPWHYLFYVDFEGHEDEAHVQQALLGILKRASFLKVLGSYPAAPLPGQPEAAGE